MLVTGPKTRPDIRRISVEILGLRLLFGRHLLLVCDQKSKPSNWRISDGNPVGFWVLGDRLSLSCSKRLSVEEISLVFLIFPRQLLGSSFFQNMKEFVVSLLRKKLENLLDSYSHYKYNFSQKCLFNLLQMYDCYIHTLSIL